MAKSVVAVMLAASMSIWACLADSASFIPTQNKEILLRKIFISSVDDCLRKKRLPVALSRQSTTTAAAMGLNPYPLILFSTPSSSDSSSSSPPTSKEDGQNPKNVLPPPPEPFLPAANPMYQVRGKIGDGTFCVKREGEPISEELTDENLVQILLLQCSDLEVNTLVWKCLGYRFDSKTESWTNEQVFPKWKEKFPNPPDFIGMQRIYTKEIDGPSLKANQQLTRSVPAHGKNDLRTHFKPLGFTGYKYAGLTPNKTRRAQCANWLLYYREELFGYTIEELKERRRLREEAEKKKEEEEKLRASLLSSDDDNNAKEKPQWKYPGKEVF